MSESSEQNQVLAKDPASAARAENHAIAIIGMAGRFPGAPSVAEFWQNIRNGVESLGQVTDAELIAAGVDPELISNPNYVKIRPYLDNIAGFDAEFFGFSPREAMIADPQQRVFLECAWEALEYAGYGAASGRGRVGVFGGANVSMYATDRLNFTRRSKFSPYELVIGNDKDALATMVSYKLDLTGPSVAVQTFCSSSLSAVHLACLSLRHGECDMALAGGVCIRVPDRIGYLYEEGGMESPDGHVRTFDADARGGNFGDGASVVLLKPLRRAIADRDTVLAVIRGSAMTNDGALRFSFTAPSVMGQARAVADAMADASVGPEDISYVEAHGTATELGDPIEVAALTRAYGSVKRKQYCLIGSVKTNIGHLDRAAGVTGLIKIVESLRHEVIPATLHYRSPNPEIDFPNSPFRVASAAASWPRDERRPRIAGLNSLGMGGTNAHVVVQEAPPLPDRARGPRRWHALPVSARSAAAADEYCAALARHLSAHEDLRLADAAFTAQVGREVFEHRRIAIADSTEAAAAVLGGSKRTVNRLLSRSDATHGRGVGFLLAGIGEHYTGMVADLYEREAVFRGYVDECQDILRQHSAIDVVGFLTGGGDPPREPVPDLASLMGRAPARSGTGAIHRTEVAQPTVFVAEYSLARTLMHWGMSPSVLVGYSVGEYVAACLAGVLSLPDALRLVAYRAELIAKQPGGSMLAVALTEQELDERSPELIERGIDVAAIDGRQVVLAGPTDAIRQLGTELRSGGIGCQELKTTHAFHSRMLEPAAAELTQWVSENITTREPAIPYISNVTGTLATVDLVTDPGYWARHMCSTVRFSDSLTAALGFSDLAFVEIGAGMSLGTMLRSHPACGADRWPLIVSALPAAAENATSDARVTEAIGRLWLAGVSVDWFAYHDLGPSDRGSATGRAAPMRVPLPTYPFQRQDYWWDDAAAVPGARGGDQGLPAESGPLPRLPEHRFIHLPVWQQTATRPPADKAGQSWLLYTDAGQPDTIAARLAEQLGAPDHTVTLVRPGSAFADGPDGFSIRPGDPGDTLKLLRALQARGRQPTRIVHLWTLDSGAAIASDAVVRRGLHTLVALARAAQELGVDSWSLDVITAGTQRIGVSDAIQAERATVLGPCRMLPVECPGVTARLIDIPVSGRPPVRQVLRELQAAPGDQVVALRDGRRWVAGYDVLDDSSADTSMTNEAAPVRRGGVYLITGGLGGIGLALAERLAEHYDARLVLFGRTPVPPRDQWDAVLADDGAAGEVRRRLQSLLRLERMGTDVALVAGDVANAADVRVAVGTAIERFGALHGVLHAAGVPGMGLMALKTNADMERVLAPKVAGTEALAAALSEVPLDFLALFSSVGSATGAVGQADYCSANAFLDAFAHTDALPQCKVVSIGWGEWTWNGWVAGLDGFEPAVREHFKEYRRKFGLTFDEGWRALLRALSGDEPHVFVSTQDFAAVVRGSRRVTVADIRAASKERGLSARHPRPDLSNPFEAPQTREQRVIAEIWAEALGMEKVGLNDNFFELGGSSLIGIGIVSDIRRALELGHLPAHILYQAPTVGALAALAAGPGPGQGQGQGHGTNGNRRAWQERDRAELRRERLRAGRSHGNE